ncbi:helix-turn-helix transcriptional regulator [Mucilaginibacter robiniae]|uniref:Helix-turn-helix transcriptional regulator n=1 Tax=Mucilaginibacter robiniae TaxID=2728022 RepID=A0A7L5E112_9SPHI|nr:helix-turn-helix transcriptional regulator [Mucilaginibacter robiniae]QJD95979.1 helix-turn-helix transcriptional regulator [Mucilaginibacter robiniae]
MSEINDSFKISLGKKINALRLARSLGVREFALIAEIEHHQLINVEKGRVDVRLSTLLKIAKGLNVPAKELLDFEV